MNSKTERQAKRAKQEDMVLHRVLWWIVGAVVLEALLLAVNRAYTYFTPETLWLAQALRSAIRMLAVVLPICFVLLLVWAVLARRSGKLVGVSSVLAGLSFVLSVCAVVIRLFSESGIRLLYIAVPAAAVLALIYYLYQREFFFAAVLGALGLLGVRVVPYHYASPAIAYTYAIVLGVVLVAAVVVFRVLQMGRGILLIRGKKVQVLNKNANYITLYVTCVLVAAVVGAALVLGGLAVLYGVLAAWLLILAVYHTVRLM